MPSAITGKAELHREPNARLIADYVREHHKNLREIAIQDEDIRELGLLLEDRDHLVSQKVRFTNQLNSTLKEYFTQALDAFGFLDNKSALQFLKKIDTYDQVKGTPKKKLEKLLDDSGLTRKGSQAMKKPGYRVSAAVINAKVRLKNALVTHVELLVNPAIQVSEREQTSWAETLSNSLPEALSGY